ncbi:MAG: hypothetical protein HMLKMBBP_03267 [Planctomycetes bacterium]|nr:hypothetical protein [Planctomycetota bacterium]
MRRAPFTVGASVAVTAVSAAVFLLLGDDVFSLVAAGALGRELCAGEGAWWRLGTAMLLHGGWMHLALNITSALVVGAVYEQRAGSVRTVITALGGGFLASLASVLTGTPVGVGASGAVMGLVGGVLSLLLLERHRFSQADRRQWLAMIGLTVAANALIGAAEPDAVDNAAHAGGLAGGFLIAALLRPRRVETEVTRGTRRLAAGILLGLLGGGVAEASLALPLWLGRRTAHVDGARAELPTWLRRAEESEGGFLGRPPLPFAMQMGRWSPDAPNPPALLRRLAASGIDVSPAWTAAAAERRVEGDVDVEELLFFPPPGHDVRDMPSVRVVTLVRRGAFATVALPASDEGERAFGSVLRGLAHTLESQAPAVRGAGGKPR